MYNIKLIFLFIMCMSFVACSQVDTNNVDNSQGIQEPKDTNVGDTGEIQKEIFLEEDVSLGEIVENEDGTKSIIADESVYSEFEVQENITMEKLDMDSLGEVIENTDGTQSIITNESVYEDFEVLDISNQEEESLGVVVENPDGTQSIIADE